MSENDPRGYLSVGQPLRVINSRYDSEGIHHGRSDETLQKLPIHVRDHEFCTKNPNKRGTGSHHPTRGKANHSLFQEPGKRTFRYLGINYHIQKVNLQIIGDNMQNRDASTRNHRGTQIVHGQPLFPIPSEYGFRQRNHRHLIPHGKGVGIRRGDHSPSERYQLQHAYRQKYALRCRDESHAQTNHHALGQTQSIYSLDQSLHTSIHSREREQSSSSLIDNSTALLLVPAAG